MNKTTRKRLAEINVKLEIISSGLRSLVDDLEGCRDDEREKYDNLSEGLQQSERGYGIERSADELDNACSELDSILQSLEIAIEYLNNASE